MNKAKKIVCSILTGLCLLLCLYVAIEVIVANNNRRPPNFFSLSVSYVPTDSMEDTIMAGDYILFTKADFDSVNVGDIIIYRSESGPSAGNFIVHRVIEKYEDYLVTKGDNNPLADSENITREMVMGKFICIVNLLNIFSNVNRNLVFIILVFIFLIIIILQAISIFLRYQKEKLAEQKKETDAKLIEELKKEILEEELAKIKEKNK